jgi:hypothetical protein
MSWHYALRKSIAGGDAWFDVVEVYDGMGYTANGIAPGGETPELVAKELTRMLKDIAQHPMIDDTGGADGG